MSTDEYDHNKDIYDQKVAYINSLPHDDPRRKQDLDPFDPWSEQTPENFFQSLKVNRIKGYDCAVDLHLLNEKNESSEHKLCYIQ